MTWVMVIMQMNEGASQLRLQGSKWLSGWWGQWWWWWWWWWSHCKYSSRRWNKVAGFKVTRTHLQVQNQQRTIGSGISQIKHRDWSSLQWIRASRTLIEENAVAAYFIILGNLADVSAWGLVLKGNFTFCWCTFETDILHTVYLRMLKHLMDWVMSFLEQLSRIDKFNHLWAVLATVPGYPAAVRVWN